MQLSPFTKRLLERFPTPFRRVARRGRILAAMDADTVIIVGEGALAVEVVQRDSERLIVDVISPVSGILDCRELSTRDRPTMLHALMPTAYARIPRSQVERVIAEDHESARLMAIECGVHASELRRRLAVLDDPDVRARVLHTLLYLQVKLGAKCPLAEGQILQVPQSVVASVAGLSRQTVNRVLGGLEELGLLRVERSMVCLLEVSGLERLSRGESLLRSLRACTACRLVDPGSPLDCARPREGRGARLN